MTLEGLHQIAVESPRFKLSSTRAQLMRHLWTVAGCICRWQIYGDLWIDGSFLTEKIDPDDVDFMIVMPGDFANKWTHEQRQIIGWFCEDKTEPAKAAFQCDSYALYVVADHVDPNYPDFLYLDAYWKKQFGVSRAGVEKGMALVRIFAGAFA